MPVPGQSIQILWSQFQFIPIMIAFFLTLIIGNHFRLIPIFHQVIYTSML